MYKFTEKLRKCLQGLTFCRKKNDMINWDQEKIKEKKIILRRQSYIEDWRK